MMLSDLHVHTKFCDGANTPEEMVLAAIERKMDRIGFSGHSYTSFDLSCCMSVDGTREYRKEIQRLKDKYSDKIEILCGIEQDLFADFPAEGYDYIIGSSHYLKKDDGSYIIIDYSAKVFEEAAKKYYRGDYYQMAEEYFENISSEADIGADIVGHFDLIAIFNQGNRFFDESNSRYLSAGKAAIDKLLKKGLAFEVNTGAISRGRRDIPYPAPEFLKYILKNSGRVILSSDAHNTETLCFEYEKWQRYIDDLRP